MQVVKKKSRVAYYDILNVVACISVVFLHSNKYFHTLEKDDWWWWRVLVEVVFFYAVPVFFMLSGATLIGYRERYTTRTFFKKRFLRTFIPFIFWSVIFYGIYIAIVGIEKVSLNGIIQNLTTGKIPYTNYWFFIPLFLLYIFMPFLSAMVLNLSRREIEVLCVILIFFQMFFPTLYKCVGLSFEMSLPIDNYVLYVLLGYYLSKYDINISKKKLILLSTCALVALAVRYYFIYYSVVKDSFFFKYLSIYALLQASCFFLLVKRMFSHHAENRCLEFLAGKSLGVYLIHTFLIFCLAKVLSPSSPIFIFVSVPIVYGLSVLITFVLQKGRYTKFIVP